MHPDGPAGLFITWTIYGTFLPGDARGWRHRRDGEMVPQPKLAEWSAERLKYPIELLTDDMKDTVEEAVRRKCLRRGWKCWTVRARSNHVHSVITAAGRSPVDVRDQIKAMATSRLRDRWPSWRNRPVWTSKGDIEFLDNDEEIALAVTYCEFAQDRKGHELRTYTQE